MLRIVRCRDPAAGGTMIRIAAFVAYAVALALAGLPPGAPAWWIAMIGAFLLRGTAFPER